MLKPDFLPNRFVIRSLGRACIAATALLMQPFTSAAADAGAPHAASVGPAHVPAPATGCVEMKIYDGDPPNLLSNAPAERVAGNGFIYKVSVPTIRRYPVDESKSTGVAFIVFPGGGYSFADMETHATALAKRLGPQGFAVFGLKYRINGGSRNVERDSLLDANRAIRFVRSHAAEWGLAENRIGIISYSAGSDLDMRLVAGGFDLGKPTATDPVERKSSRPDFVASMCTWAHGGTNSPYQFTADTPPVYLCHAQDDPSAPITVSRQIDQQLQALHILEHLEVYPTGGHDGFHVGDPNAPNRNWLDNYLPWLRTNNLIGANFGVTQEAKTNKTFIEYFLPTPTVGSLTTNIWGAATVGPRDPKNGLEDETMKQWNYWDGKIIKAPDGKYHLFCSRWDQAGGHGAWYGSVAVHATSTNLCGPYTDQGLCWPDWNRGSGHNVSCLQLKDGRYAIVESGIRPGGVFVSDSLNGPWSYLGDVQGKFCTQCNLQIMLRPDGRYQSIISDTTIGIADNVAGPYVAQGSIFEQTGVSPANMEDPCLWFSGGLYHAIINNWSQRKAYHFTSSDGIHNWQLQPGYAYDPKADFVRYTDGTVDHWNKAERPSVYIENGHVAAMTLAVIDVEKEQEHGNDGHGSKIIVIPFDGAALDRDQQPAANSPKP